MTSPASPQPASLTPWLAAVLRGEAPDWPLGTDTAAVEVALTAAQAEGVGALLLDALTRYPVPERLPLELVPALRRQGKREAAADFARELELRRILDLLGSVGLRPLAIKGTALAYSHYPQPHLRPRCDTDLLFPDRESAKRAWPLLEREGYRRPLAVSGDLVFHEWSCHRSDRLGVGQVLDIHWRINSAHYFAQALSFAELEAGARPLPGLGPQARAPSLVHALLIACLHRLAHAPEGQHNRLIWLYDLRLLAAALAEGDWADFVALARSRGLAACCLDGLLAARGLLAAPIPASALDPLAAAAPANWLTPARLAHSLGAFWCNLRALPDLPSRGRLVLQHLFPDPDYMRAKYGTAGNWRLPWLYLHRFLRGLSAKLR